MALEGNNYVGKPPFFEGNNYDYWRIRMKAHFKEMGRKIWKIVIEGYVILDDKNMTRQDDENELLNDQAINMLYGALDIGDLTESKDLKVLMGYGRNSRKFMKAQTPSKRQNYTSSRANLVSLL
jgi:hypothetical protein